MRKKPEAVVNARLVAALKLLPNVYGERVELKTGKAGRPDWDLFIGKGRVVFVESKWLYSQTQPLKEWTQKQRDFARARIKQGHLVLLLVGDAKNTYLLDAAVHIDTNLIIEWLYHSKSSIDHQHLNMILFGRSLPEAGFYKNT